MILGPDKAHAFQAINHLNLLCEVIHFQREINQSIIFLFSINDAYNLVALIREAHTVLHLLSLDNVFNFMIKLILFSDPIQHQVIPNLVNLSKHHFILPSNSNLRITFLAF